MSVSNGDGGMSGRGRLGCCWMEKGSGGVEALNEGVGLHTSGFLSRCAPRVLPVHATLNFYFITSERKKFYLLVFISA